MHAFTDVQITGCLDRLRVHFAKGLEGPAVGELTLRIGLHTRPGVQLGAAPNRGRVTDGAAANGVVEFTEVLTRATPLGTEDMAWLPATLSFNKLLRHGFAQIAGGGRHRRQRAAACGGWLDGSDLFDGLDGRDRRCACRRTAHRVFTTAATRP